MHLHQLTQQIRQARLNKGLTQAALAEASGLSRVTINQIENGVVPDIGIRKLQRVFEEVGLALTATARPERPAKDFLVMLCTSANTSFRERLAVDGLAHALLTGQVPKGYGAHLRAALDESSRRVLKGALEQLSGVKPMAELEANLGRLAEAVGSSPRSLR